MKALSHGTVIEIITALRHYRADDLRLLACFQDRSAKTPPDKVRAHVKSIQDRIDANAVALRELSEELAPWIKKFPDLKCVFEQAQQTTTNTQEN